MIYILKVGASIVLPPGIFFVIFFVISAYCIHIQQKKLAAIIAGVTLVFYLLSTGFVAEHLMGWLESAYDPPVSLETEGADGIIMLGGGAYPDVPDYDGMGALAAGPASRMLTVIRIENDLGVPVLFSGGQVYADSGKEAEIAKRNLMSFGVPEERIIVEGNSLNTNQNARYSAQLLKEHGITHPVLVTSAFHMRRSVLNFKQMGVDVIPYPTDYHASKEHVFHYTKLRPSASALVDSVTVMQETLRTIITYVLKF